MIRVAPRWVTTGGVAAEREQSIRSQHLFVDIDFIGEHYLPVEDIPVRVLRLEPGQFGVARDPKSLDITVLGLDLMPILIGKETLIDGQRATSISRIVSKPVIGGHDFINIRAFGQNLVRYQEEVDGQKVKSADIPGFKDLVKQMRIYRKLETKPSRTNQ